MVLYTLIIKLLTQTTIYTIHTQHVISHKKSQFFLAKICNELMSKMCAVTSKVMKYVSKVVKND
jgi:hypothetical protein